PKFFQYARAERSKRIIVLDHENALGPSVVAVRFPFSRPECRNRRIGPGQVQLHCGAMPHFAVDANMSTSLTQESVDLAETEPRALAYLFGREKRLEHLGQGVLVNPVAGIRHGDHDVLTGSDRLVEGLDIRLVQVSVSSL